MAHYYLNDAIIGLASERPAPGNPQAGAQQSSSSLWINSDDGKIFASVGASWVQIGQLPSGGGGASTLAGLSDVQIASPTAGQVPRYNATDSKWENGVPYPGVAGDGLTPAGLTVAGGLIAGNDSYAGVVPLQYQFSGYASFHDTPANITDGDSPLTVTQSATVVAGGFGIEALSVLRSGLLSGADYQAPTARVDDQSLSTQPLQQWRKRGAIQFQVDADGVQVHGKLKTGASVAHTLGAYSGNSVPIYDEAGTLLGYMPLYA